jgi:hypothetical protein
VTVLGLSLAATGARAQENGAATNNDVTVREDELDRRKAELDRLEAALQVQSEELKAAEEKRSNLDLRQAVLDARATLIAWRRTVEQYSLNRKLAEKGIVSPTEVDSSREAAENAELKYKESLLALEQAKLDILKEAAVISVVAARVYRTDGAQKKVDITLANLSSEGKARIAYPDEPAGGFQNLLRVPDIRLSLRKGSIIAEPYVQNIKKLDLNEEATLTFQLLQDDVEEVEADITYFDKTVKESVFLRKDSENDLPTVNSLNFDQMGQLGQTITYDLVLERLAETEKTYHLSVLNLAPELKAQFKDPEKNATVSAVKFARESTKKQLGMEIIIPQEMPQDKLDKPVTFYVLALDDAARDRLLNLKRDKGEAAITEDDLKSVGVAHERLVFTPKGIGRAELTSSDLYKEITAGKQLKIQFKVKNTGSVALRNIRMKIELPAEWEATTQPEAIDVLDLAQESTVNIDLFPSPDLGVGDYTVRVDAETTYEGQPVPIDDKIVRIHVESKANIFGGILLLLILVGALAGIATFLVRLAKR